MIPDEAVEAAARALALQDGRGYPAADYRADALEALDAALPTLLSHEREETRLAHLDAVVNARAVDRLERELDRRDWQAARIVAELRLFNHNEAADLIEGWHRK